MVSQDGYHPEASLNLSPAYEFLLYALKQIVPRLIIFFAPFQRILPPLSEWEPNWDAFHCRTRNTSRAEQEKQCGRHTPWE